MERSNDIDRMPIQKPRTWNPRDMYQEYAKFILANDPQCWGKYSQSAKRNNYWIYKTVDRGGKAKVVEVINYNRWKMMMTAYFESARTRIIEHGEGLSLGGHLGMIQAKRCERNHENKQVNFLETSKRPKIWSEEKQTMVPDLVYWVDSDYIRISWKKYKYRTNEKYYEFVPSNGDDRKMGFKDQFSQANMTNPLLKFCYQYYPLALKRENHGIPVS